MAQRTIVTTFDDLDGTEGAETVVFSFKETVYSVDLTVRNQQELLRALSPFITAGTVLSRRPARVRRGLPG
ncbi:histone-like nucleoid-structuring protein Lsr2 [Lapillicoccus sp.]|uniref:Lsr2 dimerization domain-containing protein n=1 Tax=Lapillicoccus sp. TaxID=1909287 RepID=UPI0025E4A435|nr:histone-like nucleoid-structuring protein Lsr2 [Lapillicoccus sp.]